MNIIIVNDNEIEDVKFASKLIWGKYQKGFIIYLALLFVCSLILIISGNNSEYDYQTYTNESGNYQINQYNYNSMTAFGFSIFFIFFLLIIVFFKQKSRFEQQKIYKVERTDNHTERILNSEYFEFKSDTVSRKSKWKIFETYKILGDYIFFNLYRKSNVHTEFLNLTKLNAEQRDELFMHLKKKNITKE